MTPTGGIESAARSSSQNKQNVNQPNVARVKLPKLLATLAKTGLERITAAAIEPALLKQRTRVSGKKIVYDRVEWSEWIN